MTELRIKELEQEVTLLSQLHTTVCNQRDAALVRIQQLTVDKARLELLEELAVGFAEWVRASPTLFDHRHTRDIAKISRAITWDNERVSRLTNKT